MKISVDVNNMEKYVICPKHFHTGKLVKPMDEANIDQLGTHALISRACKAHSKLTVFPVANIQRSDKATKRAERR